MGIARATVLTQVFGSQTLSVLIFGHTLRLGSMQSSICISTCKLVLRPKMHLSVPNSLLSAKPQVSLWLARLPRIIFNFTTAGEFLSAFQVSFLTAPISHIEDTDIQLNKHDFCQGHKHSNRATNNLNRLLFV